MKKILGFLMLGLAVCGLAGAACEEEQYHVERTQKVLAKKQEALNENPESQKALEEKLGARDDWGKAKEKLISCIQKDKDSSWQQKPGNIGDL